MSKAAIEIKMAPSMSSINDENVVPENIEGFELNGGIIKCDAKDDNGEVEEVVINGIVKCDAEKIAEIIEDPEIVAVQIREEVELPKPLHNLIQRIFDPNALISALRGMKLDLGKLSLEQITQDQIAAARRILKELAQELRNGLKEEHVKEATKEFYSLIPHIQDVLPLLNNPRIIDSKASMLNTLADIEIANRSIGEMILRHEYIDRKDVIQRYYEKLNCRITIVDHNSETFQLIKEYAETNHRVTDDFKLEIINVFEIYRPDEAERFVKDIGNVRLLWHGSRTVNFIGILSQGLHLPEKPRDLWFGKGVYFSDTVCLCASYCDEEDSMLLLCEVALGDIDRKNNLDFEIIKPDENKHSVKGMGMYYPSREGYRIIDDNVIVPIGKLIKRENTEDILLDYNEYIVYTIEQIKIRYLVQVNIGKKGVTRKNGLIGGEAV